MSSNSGQRKQPTSYEGYRQRTAVKPQGHAGVPSPQSAQVEDSSREDQDDLLEKVLNRDNLQSALKRVKQNGGAPGVDGMTVQELPEWLKTHWPEVRTQLQEEIYCPMPVKRVEIPKPGGKGKRKLGIPSALDRLIQQALLQVMTPIFDPAFSEASYGFRPGRKAHDAVKEAQRHIREGYRIVVDMDLESFFDTVNHDMLMARVSRKVKDKRVLKLIRSYLVAGIMVNGVALEAGEGVPQGGPLSPLLANILLDDLDKELTKRGHRYVRYADDCNLFVKSWRAGKRVMESVICFVEGRLKLKVNREKSAVARPWKRKFLGFSYLVQKGATIRLAPKTLERLKERIREITSRTRPMSMECRIEKLNTYLMGWIGYFHLAAMKGHCEELDAWIRRRLRMCLWKQWKTPKTRLRKLRGLGVPEWAAHTLANSRSGPWVMSRNTNNALANAYWQKQGLKSLTSRYNELRQLLGNA